MISILHFSPTGYLKLLVVAVILLFPLCYLQAQRPLRTYATQKMARLESGENAFATLSNSQLEIFIDDYKQSGYDPDAADEFRFIQVIFHVIYHPGTPHPTEADVYAQLKALNRDFGSIITDREVNSTLNPYQSLAVNMRLQFCLAVLPDGTPAIQYISSADRKEWDIKQEAFKFSDLGGADARESQQYLNVWVVDLTDGISGYAQMPGGLEDTDGIVIDPDFFGLKDPAQTPYTQGKTLTHLVGSYLGLHELWNESIPCADDFVTDTPIHNDPNYMVSALPHLSFCEDNPVEMTANFMDNTDDAGLSMFTSGQKLRVQAVLAPGGYRQFLPKPENSCIELDKNLDLPLPVISQTSINDLPQEDVLSLAVHPNPASEWLMVQTQKSSQTPGVLHVYNGLGILVFQQAVESDLASLQIKIPVDSWPPGTYLTLWQSGAASRSAKVVIIP